MLRNNKSLRYRMLFGLLGIAVVVLLLITVVSYFLVSSALGREVKARAQNLVHTEVNRIDGFFNGVGRIPVVLGSASAMDSVNNEAALRARMREVVENNADIYGSTISFEPYSFYADQKYFAPYYYRGGADGEIEYVQFGSDDYVYWEWEWYTGPRDTGGLYWTKPFFDEGAGEIWMVTAAYPVVRDGRFVAVATVDVPIDDVKQSLSELRVGDLGYALMFDRDGGLIAASGIEGLQEESLVQEWIATFDSPELDLLFDQAFAGGEGLMAVPDVVGDAGRMWAIYTMIPSTDWHVMTFISSDELLAPVVEVSLAMLGISVLGLLGLAGGIFTISNTITRPIETLRNEALAIASGELTRRVPTERGDEIGALGRAFNQMADELASLLSGLELRVAERTAKLQAAAEVSRATTSFLDPQELLHEVVDLVRERFGLYYVGLFLVDEGHEYAVLQAGTGQAGQEMLARNHKLAVGGDSMIGQCVSRAEARIALDVGEEAVRFDNPFLPDTHSEMALPLRSRGQVIGAVSVQSVAESAFDETDISVMQTMADQVATAIDNARLYAQAQESLDAERRAYGELSQDAWTALLRARPDLGYRCDAQGVRLSEKALASDMASMGESGQIAVKDGLLAVPLKIRGHVVGVVRLRKPDDASAWTTDETEIVTSLAEQVSLALESARFYQDTVRRAAREQLVSEVTTRMRETLDLETVLKVAAQEMRQALGVPELGVRLVTSSSDRAGGTEVSDDK